MIAHRVKSVAQFTIQAEAEGGAGAIASIAAAATAGHQVMFPMFRNPVRQPLAQDIFKNAIKAGAKPKLSNRS